MTIAEELTEAKARAELAEKAKVEAEAAMKANGEAFLAVTKERDELKVKMEAEQKAHAGCVSEALSALDKEQKAHTATKSELEKAQKALANPAFAAAAATGSKKAVEEGAAAGADVATFATQAEALAAYDKVQGAKEREEFRTKHAGVLGLK